jgi:hypothetical protein
MDASPRTETKNNEKKRRTIGEGWPLKVCCQLKKLPCAKQGDAVSSFGHSYALIKVARENGAVAGSCAEVAFGLVPADLRTVSLHYRS